jgi:hypothetical protein
MSKRECLKIKRIGQSAGKSRIEKLSETIERHESEPSKVHSSEWKWWDKLI